MAFSVLGVIPPGIKRIKYACSCRATFEPPLTTRYAAVAHPDCPRCKGRGFYREWTVYGWGRKIRR